MRVFLPLLLLVVGGVQFCVGSVSEEACTDPETCASDGQVPGDFKCEDLIDEGKAVEDVFDDVIGCYRRKVAEAEKTHGLKHAATATAMLAVGHALDSFESFDDALVEYQKVLQLGIELYGKKGMKVSQVMQDTAACHMKMGRFEEAPELWKDAHAALKGFKGANNRERLQVLLNKADILDNLGLSNYAFGNYEEAHEAWTKSLKAHDAFDTYKRKIDKQTKEEALHMFDMELELDEEEKIVLRKSVGIVHSQLGGTSNKLQRYDAAIAHYESAIAIFITLDGTEALMASTEYDKGVALYYSGDMESSKQAMSKSLSIREGIGMESSAEYKMTKETMDSIGFEYVSTDAEQHTV